MPNLKRRSFNPAKLAKLIQNAGPVVRGVLTALDLIPQARPYVTVAKSLALALPEGEPPSEARQRIRTLMRELETKISDLESQDPEPKSPTHKKLLRMKRKLDAYKDILLALEE